MDAWLPVYYEVARGNGGEPDAGRRLVSWARAAGFTDVTATASAWCYATPEEREWWSESWGGRLVESYLNRAGIRPRERFVLSTLDAIAVMVDRGLGDSLVPDWSPPWPEGLTLAKLPLPLPTEPRRISFLWMKGSARIRLLRVFLEKAAASLR